MSIIENMKDIKQATSYFWFFAGFRLGLFSFVKI